MSVGCDGLARWFREKYVRVRMGPFAAEAMLFWSGLAAVPIVLHLLRRRRRRTVSWGAMRFLQAAIAQRARRFQLWRLLLLLLRVALVLLIALALARPQWGSAPGEGAGEVSPPRLALLIVDVSPSMDAPGARLGETRLQVAQQLGRGLIERATARDAFLLLRMGGTAQALVREPSYRGALVERELMALETEDAVADVGAAIAEAEAMIAEAREAGWSQLIDVWILSDAQRTSWSGVEIPEDWERASKREASKRDDDSAAGNVSDSPRVRLVDCGGEEPTNVSVSELRVEADELEPSGSISRLSTRLAHASGRAAVGPGLAQLYVDGRVEQSQPTPALEPGASATLRWQVRLTAGTHALEVRLQVDDALAIDNVSRRLVQQSGRVRVAIFAGQANSGRYAALALAPQTAALMDVETLAWNQLTRVGLEQFDVWLLSDPPALTAAQQRRLEQFLSSGGGVVWGLGPALENRGGSDSGGLEWGVAAVRSLGEGQVDPLDYRSEIVQPFESFPGSGLLTLPVFRLWELETSGAWESALAMVDRETDRSYPLLATWEQPRGGRQVLWATPWGPGDAEQPWNAAIAWPAFVPLLQECVRWVADNMRPEPAFTVGELLRGTAPADDTGQRLVDEEGNTVEVRVETRRGSRVDWNAGGAERVGVYRWETEAGRGGAAAVVNVDLSEGDLSRESEWGDRVERIEAEAALADWDRGAEEVTGRVAREGAMGRGAEDGVSLGEGGEAFWYFLLAALGVLMTESALVRFLERRY